MPIVTVRYKLPEEKNEYECARLGKLMAEAIWEVEQRLRSLLKHGGPSEETALLAEEIRQIIRDICPDALEL